jgi:hypothetical protein
MVNEILVAEIRGQLAAEVWKPEVGDLVVFKDFKGRSVGGRINRFRAGYAFVKCVGNIGDVQVYNHVIIPVQVEDLYPAI